MVSLDEMKSCIQEWFAQETTIYGVAKLYAELEKEIDDNLKSMTELIVAEMKGEEA